MRFPLNISISYSLHFGKKMLPCLTETTANKDGPRYKGVFHRWGEQAFLPSCPSVFTGFPCCISLPVCVGFLCLECPPWQASAPAFLTLKGFPGLLRPTPQLPTVAWHTSVLHLSKWWLCSSLPRLSTGGTPSMGSGHRRGTGPPSCPLGTQLILYVTMLGRTRSNIKTKQITHVTLKTWECAPV